MKALFSLLILTFAFAMLAGATEIKNPMGSYSVALFTNYSGYGSGGATTRYSVAQKVDRDTQKTVFVQGYSTGTTEASSLAGTVALQCGLTSSGPWVVAKDRAGSATSATSSTVFDLDTLCQYVRASYLKSAAGAPNISVWLLYGGP